MSSAGNWRNYLLTTVSLGLISALQGQPSIPKFTDFPVSNIYSGPVRLPKFQTGNPGKLPYPDGDLRCIGTNPEERELFLGDEKPNFAGHYIFHACSCGSGCASLFMWDAQTGQLVRNFPFGSVEVGPYFPAEEPVEYEGAKYRVDGRLLTVEGCFHQGAHPPSSKYCAKYFYVFRQGAFVLLKKTPLRVPPA